MIIDEDIDLEMMEICNFINSYNLDIVTAYSCAGHAGEEKNGYLMLASKHAPLYCYPEDVPFEEVEIQWMSKERSKEWCGLKEDLEGLNYQITFRWKPEDLGAALIWIRTWFFTKYVLKGRN